MRGWWAGLLLLAFAAEPAVARPIKADTVFVNGYVYTVDAKDSVAQAVAVRGGRIVYVGSNAGARRYTGRKTKRIDLHGRMLMPGLTDGHMHPQSGGLRLLSCNLNYEALTVPQFQARIQACIDAEPNARPDDWLLVINWFEQAVLPAGRVLSRADLDSLRTTRPIKVHSTYGHTNLTNTRGLQLAGIYRDTPNPKDGVIERDKAGEATGRLEDAAQDLIDKLIPPPSAEMNLKATQLALKAMREQGITTFLDAYTDIETMTAYRTVSKTGGLTARAHFAVLIDAGKDYDADKAIAEVLREKAEFEQRPKAARPVMRVHTAKLFLDGVIAAPSFTGVMVSPYFENTGTAQAPVWRPGTNKGPQPYFSDAQLQSTLIKLSDAGLDAHMHADGDGAVRQGLDAIAALRKARPDSRMRPALAHDEIVDPADYPRFKALDALPVLSFQWQKPAVDTVPARDFLGPDRFALIEPAGFLEKAGARIVYGSDWPVDPLNEWLALQVAVTRAAIGEDAATYPGRLGSDPGLTIKSAIRAITLNAAYSLHQDDRTGSIEVGKFADLIVLDRNLLKIAPDQVSGTKVLMTMTGGKVVYQVKAF